jgi:hypothetical protein
MQHWIYYNHEIIDRFMLVDIIKTGSLLLLPLPSQKSFDKGDAIRQLLERTRLDGKLQHIREQGNTIIKKQTMIMKITSSQILATLLKV